MRRIMIGDEVRLVPKLVPTEVELRENGDDPDELFREMDEMLDVAIALGDFGEGIGALGDIFEVLGSLGDLDLDLDV